MKEEDFKKLVKDFDPSIPEKPSLRNLTSPDFSRPKRNPATDVLGLPHVESFNFAINEGLELAVRDLDPVQFILGDKKISLEIFDAGFETPRTVAGAVGIINPKIYPSESRQRGNSYKAPFIVRVRAQIEGVLQPLVSEKAMGSLPVVLLSEACNLKDLSPEELVSKGEHPSEWGGYFIISGHERIIRMLLTTRRNYPIAMSRLSWKNRGKYFSDLGVLFECSKPDLTVTKNVLHFVNTGTAKLMFSWSRELFFVPIIMILKCLSDRTDMELYAHLVSGTPEDDHYYRACLKTMLAEPHNEGLFSSAQVKAYIGKSFREKVKYSVPEWLSDEEICDFLMTRAVCINVENYEDKFQILVFMVKKLFSLVQNRCLKEGVDSVMMQEIVVGGHLYLQLLKEKMGAFLNNLKAAILKKSKSPTFEFNLQELNSSLSRTRGFEKVFENFLGTGNLPSSSGLGLMQSSGLVIMAENINRMRYMSHFRAVHRGSFFQEMRTTEVRALLPDAWGFICPVHTPDGAPCGLLNHLAMSVEVVTHPPDDSKLPEILYNMGVTTLEDAVLPGGSKTIKPKSLSVFLNGKMLGYICGSTKAQKIADKLRAMKIKGNLGVPRVTEIVLINFSDDPKLQGLYPGMFIFTGASRMMRPVVNLSVGAVEYIGTFEQIFLDICIVPEEAYTNKTTHRELRPTSFLSNLASLIPLPDFNQSPRNMYQCQMGKQTMATPIHTWHLNSESKVYRLQTPASPLFRPAHYDYIGLDDFPMGTNAIVAVISYTGYDMEDAMIINKSSYERGFCAGSIYKSTFIDLNEITTGNKKSSDVGNCELSFERDPSKNLSRHLDSDGLPYPGIPLMEGDPLYCYKNSAEGTYIVKRYEGKELIFVDSVKLCSNDTGTAVRDRVAICYRVPRNPSVGDKFASRAGQKGICSRKWITEDLPWTESGLSPDIVFNPHGFPSRMTIAMMIECMAGKGAAAHGVVYDATPFTFSEDKNNDAIDYFGKQLESAGYNYYGTETMYSGTDGVEMKAEIFFGVIHYQRLRHMVSDKFQVRSQGPVDQITHQPIKGRRRGGGVRFGEMERDALLSHGSMFLLQDRLFHGSDKTRVNVCTRCGSLLSPRVSLPEKSSSIKRFISERSATCVICGKSDSISDIYIPYIFLHLVAQLAGVNIKVRLETKHN